ncbi:hypothetical protein [Rhodococcoides yunnanense]|uniref:hypothetical protein n=1 Tax=Rhodococcoides yunnanense TaxID=278209 RepID=UPI000934685E|nr:hypothetical protein [Rhodococcus yunnanensis]
MLVTSAETSDDRAEVQAFFETVFSGIAPDAVPSVHYDSLYEPVILMIRDHAGSGRIVAAVLSCRTTEIAGIVGFSAKGSHLHGTALT